MPFMILIILFLIITLPIAWFVSEFWDGRFIRMALGILAILSSFGVAFVVGALQDLNYNAWYGSSTKSLISTIVEEMDAGHDDRVMAVLRNLNQQYRPTYENRANYRKLVDAATAQMREDFEIKQEQIQGQESIAPDNLSYSTAHPLPPKRLAVSDIKPEIQISKDKIRDVFIDDRNITNFTNAHHIYETLVSPNNLYLLVWHMDNPPRKVSLYNLETHQKVATFELGAGGHIGWASHNLIYHQYGAGINNHIFAVYSIEGKKVWAGSASGVALCESGKYVFTFPTLPAVQEISIMDIRNGNVIGKATPDNIANTIMHHWMDGHTIRFWYNDIHMIKRSVDITIEPE